MLKARIPFANLPKYSLTLSEPQVTFLDHIYLKFESQQLSRI